MTDKFPWKYVVYDATEWYEGVDECESTQEAENKFSETVNKHTPYDDAGWYDYVIIAKVIKAYRLSDGKVIVVDEVRK